MMKPIFILALSLLTNFASAQTKKTYTPVIDGQLSLRLAVNFYKNAGMPYKQGYGAENQVSAERDYLDAYGIDCRATSIPSFQFKCSFFTDQAKTQAKKFTGEPARVLYLAVTQGMKEQNPYFPQCTSEKCKMTMTHLHWEAEPGNPWGHATFYNLFIGNETIQ
jgi:hypothetical protein